MIGRRLLSSAKNVCRTNGWFVASGSSFSSALRLSRGIANQKEQIDNYVNSKDYYDQVRQLAKLQGLTDIRTEYHTNKKDFEKFKTYTIVRVT